MLKLPEINPSDLYYLMGKALYATQVLDHELAHCLTLWQNLPADESVRTVEESLKKTFGQLLAALRKHQLVPDGLDDRLEEYREERNWLVHRLHAESSEQIYSSRSGPTLMERVRCVHGQAKDLLKVFDELNDKWYAASGGSQETLQCEIMRRIERINRQH